MIKDTLCIGLGVNWGSVLRGIVSGGRVEAIDLVRSGIGGREDHLENGEHGSAHEGNDDEARGGEADAD